MKLSVDYLIVGSGLTGSTLARLLADAGREVLVLEKRSHVGGNVHDHYHPSGIRVHTYGPHYFRTNKVDVWEYVNRFASFYPYQAIVKSVVDGKYENWPIQESYIKQHIGSTWEPEFQGTPQNLEEASLAMMPREIYEKFVKGYNEKQWGSPVEELSPSLSGRFSVRADDDPRLMQHRYQGIPTDGYAAFMTKMLEGIPVMLNIDYLQQRESFQAAKRLIFTGPIDEFFNCDAGRLTYRTQRRTTYYLPDKDYVLPCGQVNDPNVSRREYLRILEWKHMLPKEVASRIKGTVLTTENPEEACDSNRYEYPIPIRQNLDLLEIYKKRAAGIPNLLICGRLGEYRYMDMDHAIERAMELFPRIIDNPVPEAGL